ncbi:MAG: glycosyltransferase family 2 protein [Candidatus Omnitrophica bacterium]|nr:glycosyltransferase family 2 protein [Candidatus Omnitrophota bacterium]
MNLKKILQDWFYGLSDYLRMLLRVPYAARDRQTPSRVLLWILSWTVRHVHGPRRPKLDKKNVLLLCILRDGEEFIPDFMRHHQERGIGHFVFLDNDSKDKTLSILKQYPNVTILQSRFPYKTYAFVFRAYFKRKFAGPWWTLFMDIDELFDFPFSEKIDIRTLVHYLETNGYNAVLANTLDMFSDKTWLELKRGPQGSLREILHFYDVSAIQRAEEFLGKDDRWSQPPPLICEYRAGVRQKVFHQTHCHLSKYPLYDSSKGIQPISGNPHEISGRVCLADISCVLLHYTFSRSFPERTQKAIREKNYTNHSEKYLIYHRQLQSTLNWSIYSRSTQPKPLGSTEDLIRDQFLVVSEKYLKFIENPGSSPDI